MTKMKEMLCLLMCVSIFIAGCNSIQANSSSAHLPADEPDLIENTWGGIGEFLEDATGVIFAVLYIFADGATSDGSGYVVY